MQISNVSNIPKGVGKNNKDETVAPIKVFVGLSGGVDSAVSALLLRDAGYDVTGVYIKTWQPDYVECTWKSDRQDAMRVAAQLGIKFLTLDLEKEYKADVIDYMISEYRKGNTPNPDIMCNRFIKFGGFWEFAKHSGADYVATGHYARIVRGDSGDLEIKTLNKNNFDNINNDKFKLLKAKDEGKDQSYFLYTLTKDDLKHVIFPIGNLNKTEVRDMAIKNDLWVSRKKDSQGICMLGDLDIKEFLKNEIDIETGDVLSESGEVIGIHDGAMLYTIGERHGFIINTSSEISSPMYVYKKDVDSNTISVRPAVINTKDIKQIDNHLSGNSEDEILIKKFKIKYTTWVNQSPAVGDIYLARGRYRAPLAKVKCISESEYELISGDILNVSGQSLVIYNCDNEECIGGGILM